MACLNYCAVLKLFPTCVKLGFTSAAFKPPTISVTVVFQHNSKNTNNTKCFSLTDDCDLGYRNLLKNINLP